MHGSAHASGMTHKRHRQPPGEIPVHLALDSIQEALRLLDHAAQTLSRVDRMIPMSRKLGSLSNQLSQAWFAVSAAANQLQRQRHSLAD